MTAVVSTLVTRAVSRKWQLYPEWCTFQRMHVLQVVVLKLSVSDF